MRACQSLPVQVIAAASAASGFFVKNALFYKVRQLPLSRCPAGVGRAGILAVRQSAFKTSGTGIEHPVEHFALTRIELRLCMGEPEPVFERDIGQQFMGSK